MLLWSAKILLKPKRVTYLQLGGLFIITSWTREQRSRRSK